MRTEGWCGGRRDPADHLPGGKSPRRGISRTKTPSEGTPFRGHASRWRSSSPPLRCTLAHTTCQRARPVSIPSGASPPSPLDVVERLSARVAPAGRLEALRLQGDLVADVLGQGMHSDVFFASNGAAIRIRTAFDCTTSLAKSRSSPSVVYSSTSSLALSRTRRAIFCRSPFER